MKNACSQNVYKKFDTEKFFVINKGTAEKGIRLVKLH